MVNLSALAYIATLASFVLATPSPIVERSPQESQPALVPVGQEYYLQTKVLSGDPSKGGLYVTAYHTGAGLNDAVLIANISHATKGFLNGTYQEFSLFDGVSYPAGLELAYTEFYADWLPVHLNIGYGDDSFAINTRGLVSSNPEWTGWLVCDWSHGLPALFWSYFYTEFPIPCSCAKVELCAVPV